MPRHRLSELSLFQPLRSKTATHCDLGARSLRRVGDFRQVFDCDVVEGADLEWGGRPRAARVGDAFAREQGLTLFPESQQAGESVAQVLEQIAARLGPGKVLRPVVTEDHRVEWMCHGQPAPLARAKMLARSVDIAQPTFILPVPLCLATRGDQPNYKGVLLLLVGPHRVEGG